MLSEKSDTKDHILYDFNYVKYLGKEIYRKREQGYWKWGLTASGLKGFGEEGVIEIV